MKQLQKTEINELKSHFRGDLFLPNDVGYDEVRQIWNAMIDRRPALVARCTSSEDVVQAVRFARKRNLIVSIRGAVRQWRCVHQLPYPRGNRPHRVRLWCDVQSAGGAQEEVRPDKLLQY